MIAARVSYPDAGQAFGGQIYIIYDFDRYHMENNGKAIRMAIIREEDIRAGRLVSSDSRLNLLVNRATGRGNKLERDDK